MHEPNLFIQSQSERSQNLADFWRTYRPFLHSKNAHQANDIILKKDDSFILYPLSQKSVCRAFQWLFRKHFGMPVKLQKWIMVVILLNILELEQ